jgi:hypothetical protein
MGGITMKRLAAVWLALLTLAGPAQALTVSMKVDPLLKEAEELRRAGNREAAMAKLDEAEAVAATTTPDDIVTVKAIKQFMQTPKGHPSSQP